MNREILLYKKLQEKGVDIKFLTYGDNNDLQYKQLLKNIDIIPIYNQIKSRNTMLMLIKSFFLPLKLKEKFKEINLIKTNQLQGS